MEVCCKSMFFVSEWVSLELGLRFFSSCNGSTATVFFESKLFEGKYEPRCVQLICCFHNWFMTWLKWRNALPPVYPAGTVVRRSITSCPVQRIPIWDGELIGVGDPAFICRRQPLTSCCRRLKIKTKGSVSLTQRATSTQKLNYLGEILAYELRT